MSTNETLQGFLDELASGNPTPGGGGAAALSGAMGAALVSMVCNLTIGKKKYAAVEEEMQAILAQSEALRQKLTAMIAEDAVAFQAVMASYGLPKATEEEQATRQIAISEASKQATLVPLAVAQACYEVMTLAKPTAEKGNSNVISDVGAAITAAESGLRTSVLNVLINLNFMQDKAFVSEKRAELDDLLAKATPLAAEVYEFVKGKL